MKTESPEQGRTEADAAAASDAIAFVALSEAAQARAQRAYERIAGDEGLTGSLTDRSASRLLAWARQEVVRLAAATEGLDDEAAKAWLAPRLSDLRQRLRAIARQSAAAAEPEGAVRSLLLAAAATSRAEAPPAQVMTREDEERGQTL